MTPDSNYTAFATVHASPRGIAKLILTYRDADGATLRSFTGRPVTHGTTKIQGTAPSTATTADLTMQVIGGVAIDDVLISAQLTDLGTQLPMPSSANGSAYSTDGQGHDMAYSVMAGADGVDARLAGFRLDTRTLELDIPIPGSMGSWGAVATEDGTVYIGSYNYSQADMGGRLYSYTPGAEEVVDLGRPVPGEETLWDVTLGPDGSIIGGTYPSGVLWKYVPGEGFSTIGPRPILPDIDYVRSAGYDPVTDLVFAGTGTSAHIVACHAEGSGECTNILPESYAKEYQWVYDMAVGDGRVFARVLDGDGNDRLVVLKPEVATDGTVTATVENDIAGLDFPGTTEPFEGSVYYARDTRLFRYDIETGTETDLHANTTINARRWAVRRMVDQEAFPGDTVVGINAGGVIATYGIQDGQLEVGQVDRVPNSIAEIESSVAGPDGRIYNAGYLVGGLSAYTPMRSDARQDLPLSLGYGQAEGMTVLDGRVYQGIYPGGKIMSFAPETVDTPPREDCTIGEEQDRPYGMLGAPNGKVYAGTMAAYGRLSGALTEFDPATGECTPYVDIVPNQSIVGLVWSQGKVVAGSLVWGGLGVLPSEPEAKLAVFDPQTKTSQIVDLPIPGLRSVTGMTTAADGMVWLMAENWIMAFDPTTNEFSSVREAFPEFDYGTGPDSPRITAYDSTLATAPDGRIYGTIRGKYLFELDPENGTTRTIYESHRAYHVSFDDYGNVYVVVAATHLLRYVPEPKITKPRTTKCPTTKCPATEPPTTPPPTTEPPLARPDGNRAPGGVRR